jgi:hypothetical protein
MNHYLFVLIAGIFILGGLINNQVNIILESSGNVSDIKALLVPVGLIFLIMMNVRTFSWICQINILNRRFSKKYRKHTKPIKTTPAYKKMLFVLNAGTAIYLLYCGYKLLNYLLAVFN